jgi:hypothetical protein
MCGKCHLRDSVYKKNAIVLHNHRRERVTVSRFSVTFQDGGLFVGKQVSDFYSGPYYKLFSF